MPVPRASSGDRVVEHGDVWKKEPAKLEVPIFEIDSLESITLGFRSEFLDITDNAGNGGRVLACAGWGDEGIIVEFKEGDEERQAAIRASDLLILWVETFNREAAEAMREARKARE